MRNYLLLMRLHRPIGVYLLLWPTLWALWIAGQGRPDWKIIVIFILGVVVMRSAGCVINDIADRNFDGHVARTKNRPLITGQVTLREAKILFIILCAIALLLVLQLNIFTIKLSLIGLALAIIYPFTKRYTYWPQLILGMAFGWAVPMAFAAQLNHIPAVGWWLFIVALLWPLAYDTLYAMVDREDDKLIGVKSTALLFGRHDRLMVGLIQLVVLILLATIGWVLQLKILYFVSLLIVAGLIFYQLWLIKARDPQRCFRAFLNNHWLGLVVFLGICIGF
jgi:4-hydroxybenzoate polyprenyltransferase